MICRLQTRDTRPFARFDRATSSNVIVNKLTRIHDYLLRQTDLELYQHLETLEIPPQVYGMYELDTFVNDVLPKG